MPGERWKAACRAERRAIAEEFGLASPREPWGAREYVQPDPPRVVLDKLNTERLKLRGTLDGLFEAQREARAPLDDMFREHRKLRDTLVGRRGGA